MCFFHLDITISSVSLTKSPSSVPIAGNTTTYSFNCSVNFDCSMMYCEMDTVNVVWLLNGNNITDSSPYVTITNGVNSNTGSTDNTFHSVLTTEGTINTSHAGIYQCIANLASDTDVVMSNNVTLNVQSKLLTPTTHCLIIYY